MPLITVRIYLNLVLCPRNGKWVMSPLSTKRVKRQTKTISDLSVSSPQSPNFSKKWCLINCILPLHQPSHLICRAFSKDTLCATAALIKLTDDWRRALDEKKDVGVAAIELSKAFDCICHDLLPAKSKAYGVKEPVPQLIRSYLHYRKQRVICNGSCCCMLLEDALVKNNNEHGKNNLIMSLFLRSWIWRRIEQSLTIFFKCFKENGPCYISNLF